MQAPPFDEEADALRWLEQCKPPSIGASRGVARRSIVSHFVPDNDVRAVGDYSGAYSKVSEMLIQVGQAQTEAQVAKVRSKIEQEKQKGAEKAFRSQPNLAVLPDERSKQARTYPTVVPDCSVVTYLWAEEVPNHLLGALDAVCARVHRLGHSSSLVSCVLVTNHQSAPDTDDSLPEDCFSPSTSRSAIPIRVPSIGMFDRFVGDFELHQASEPRTMPSKSRGYAWERPGETVARSNMAGTLVVIPFGSFADRSVVRPSITAGPKLAQALKGALLAASEAAPSALSGHVEGERPSAPTQAPHVAFVPLPFVGSRGDGRLLGIGVLVPDSLDNDSRSAVFESINRFLSQPNPALTWQGARFPVSAESTDDASALRAERWAGPARRWASITPIVLDRYTKGRLTSGPGALDEAAEIVGGSCLHLGLPHPVSIETTLQSPVVGSRDVHRFGPIAIGGRNRGAVHAVIEWEEPIEGPLLVGAGRFGGFGLLLPLKERS